MRISIVIPSRDAGRYIAQTIASALDQTRRPDEIIVVDDGSTDDTVAIAERFAGAEPCVRVYAGHAGHASRTRNEGALAASGDALIFLDSDDVLGPDALEALAAALDATPAGVAACPWYRLELIEGRWLERPPSCAPRRSNEDALSAWLRGWYYPPCAVLWSRAAFERAGRWDEYAVANQDGDLMMRALVDGIPLAESRRGRAYYRRRPAGESSVSGARMTRAGLMSRLRTIEKIVARLEERDGIARYAGSIAAALDRVGRDGTAHPDVVARACALARSLPSFWVRTASRLVRRRGDEIVPAVGSGMEIRFGLDRAAGVLAAHTASADGRGGAAAAATAAPPRPRVTVVVPTFNRAADLRRAVDSVLAQTFTDFELLVVDDGSTDATPDVVRQYADPRVRYLRQPRNAGVSAARNRGLREARADLVAFLDSDDAWMPHKLTVQVEQFARLPARVGLTYAGVENHDGRGARSITTPARRGDVFAELLLANVIHGTSGVMIRRSVVAAAGFFDEGIPAIEDYEYWLRIARFFDVDYLEEPLSTYYDPAVAGRKSTDRPANIAARAWLYRRHAASMRRAGVAHLFLRESLRRALRARADGRTVRRLALQAVLEAPLSRMTLAALLQTLLPRAGHVRWVQHHAALD